MKTVAVLANTVFFLSVVAFVLTSSLLAAQLGDCLQLKQEVHLTCSNVHLCPNGHTAGVCFANTYACPNNGCLFCTSGAPCQGDVVIEGRQVGTCTSGSPSPCTHCATYYCASDQAYCSVNTSTTPPQCQGPTCMGLWYCEDCCAST